MTLNQRTRSRAAPCQARSSRRADQRSGWRGRRDATPRHAAGRAQRRAGGAIYDPLGASLVGQPGMMATDRGSRWEIPAGAAFADSFQQVFRAQTGRVDGNFPCLAGAGDSRLHSRTRRRPTAHALRRAPRGPMNEAATSLDRLHDIVLPPEVPWWPLAPGWYVVVRHPARSRSRPRPSRLEALAGQCLSSRRVARACLVDDAAGIAELLRRTALAVAPRAVIARNDRQLRGWTGWPRNVLRPCPSRARATHRRGLCPADAKQDELRALRDYAAHWIARHQVTGHQSSSANGIPRPVRNRTVLSHADLRLSLDLCTAAVAVAAAQRSCRRVASPGWRYGYRSVIGCARSSPGALPASGRETQFTALADTFPDLVAAAHVAGPSAMDRTAGDEEPADTRPAAARRSVRLDEQEDFTNAAGKKVDRLTAVKEVVGDFLVRREGDRVGLVVFGDAPFLQAPFSTDLSLSRRLLDETAIGMAGPRTAFGDAIGLGVGPVRSKRCPGENHHRTDRRQRHQEPGAAGRSRARGRTARHPYSHRRHR